MRGRKGIRGILFSLVYQSWNITEKVVTTPLLNRCPHPVCFVRPKYETLICHYRRSVFDSSSSVSRTLPNELRDREVDVRQDYTLCQWSLGLMGKVGSAGGGDPLSGVENPRRGGWKWHETKGRNCLPSVKMRPVGESVVTKLKKIIYWKVVKSTLCYSLFL